MQIIYLKSDKERTRTSAFVGVNWHVKSQKWRAAISIHGTKKILGYFDSELEAAKAYNEVAKRDGRPFNVLP